MATMMLLASLAPVPVAWGQAGQRAVDDTRFGMEGVGITERVGEQLPLELTFTDERGRAVRLGDYFDGRRPVILNLVYYNCPSLCTVVLSEQVRVMKQMQWTAGERFRVVSVSFNPDEGPELAAAKKRSHIELLGRPEAAEGWAFLTGDEEAIEELTRAVGFTYRWVEENNQYAHDSALMIATPDGRLSRYLRGVVYDRSTLRLALVEAADGRIGTASDRLWLRICGYDPRYGKYVVRAMQVMKIGGALTLAVMAAGAGAFWLHERRRKREGRAVAAHA